MSSYPGGLDSFTNPIAGQPLNSPSQVAIIEAVHSALIAIQTELGLTPSGAAADLAARLTQGIGLRQVLVIEASTTFVKADYPWLRAVLAGAQGGGGGGGSVTAANEAIGGGGNAGTYAESFLLASALGASEAVTVGLGGTAVTGAEGNAGGNSSFGAHVVGEGGLGGSLNGGTNPPVALGGTGQLVVPGGRGGPGGPSTLGLARHGAGGDSYLGKGGPHPIKNGEGYAGQKYGGGGGGGYKEAVNKIGGDGANGVVILKLYA